MSHFNSGGYPGFLNNYQELKNTDWVSKHTDYQSRTGSGHQDGTKPELLRDASEQKSTRVDMQLFTPHPHMPHVRMQQALVSTHFISCVPSIASVQGSVLFLPFSTTSYPALLVTIHHYAFIFQFKSV